MTAAERTLAYDGLAVRLALFYSARAGAPVDVVLMAARNALARAAVTFDPSRGSFAPFAKAEIRRKAARAAARTLAA